MNAKAQDKGQLMKTTRRGIFGGLAAGISYLPFSRLLAAESSKTDQRPVIISTWPFGKPANEEALKKLQSGGSTLDAVEAGIRQAEAAGLGSVGITGGPNAAGFVQQDACIIHGPNQLAGSVAAIEGVKHPISAARAVMEKSPHVLLVGSGAHDFAVQNGCESVDISKHQAMLEKWKKEHRPQKPGVVSGENHDTISLLVLGPDGTISGGCSTSGLKGKLPGRVGDSPIIGSGVYVDNQVGAAGATGVGENVMRFCGSFLIVEFMRQGLDPTSACQKAIRRIASMDPSKKDLAINFIALDKQGRFGAAGTGNFPHAVTYPGSSKVHTAKAIKL